jgi:hypothetical protein
MEHLIAFQPRREEASSVLGSLGKLSNFRRRQVNDLAHAWPLRQLDATEPGIKRGEVGSFQTPGVRCHRIRNAAAPVLAPILAEDLKTNSAVFLTPGLFGLGASR